MLTLITHEDPHWQAAYQSHGRENGAATYSREILQFQVPVWDTALSGYDATISTCPLMYGEPGSPNRRDLPGGDLAVQYLHAWPYSRPLRAPYEVQERLLESYSRVVFVVAYKPFQAFLAAHGLTALYVPMSIDTHRLRPYVKPLAEQRDDVIAYFGNVRPTKRPAYQELLSHTSVIHVQEKQPQAWETLSRFKYGVGVGRCALEMAALGLRVLIHGAHYGGLVMDHGHYLAQQSVNFNGRITTGPQRLRDGLRQLPESMLWYPMDSRESVEWLRTEIWEKLDGRRLRLQR